MADLVELVDKKLGKKGECECKECQEEILELKIQDAKLKQRISRLEEFARTRGGFGGESDGSAIPKA